MQSLISLIIFFFFFLLYFLPPFVAAESSNQQYYDNCAPVPFTCGPLTISLTYPFRLPARHDYCGHPGFLLECLHDGLPIINIAGRSYRVLSVDYINHLMAVADDVAGAVAPTGEPSSCPQLSIKNTTLNSSLYQYYTDRDQYLTLLINCSRVGSLGLPGIVDMTGCLHSYYMIGDGSSLPGAAVLCRSTVVVTMNLTAPERVVRGVLGFEEALHEGFTVQWMPGKGWCSRCVDSGGVCGHNFMNSSETTCYCPFELGLDGFCVNFDSGGTQGNLAGIAIGVGVGTAGLTAACCLCLFWYRRKKRRQLHLIPTANSEPSNMKSRELGNANYHTHIFSYDELQEATNGFDASRELGDGGFGTVYQGRLRDGRIVAVKRLYENNYRRVEQFMNEVDILSRLRHQNLVTLYGCTSRHSRELLLVYEFVANGTVADHLHGPHAGKGALTWPVRMSIAIETADALAYLHATEPQIIHRDVKTNNILLDNNFHVKVADFGLSRLFPVDASHVSTAPQGTPGYVDPDYHQCYQLTDKSDVYSFGVVLAELISSKPAVDICRHRHEINLSNMMINRIQNRELEQFVDPEITGFQSDREKEMMIALVAELAFRCLQGEKEMRPSIKEVLEELGRIQNGAYKAENGTAETDVKTATPFSPDSVTAKWDSSSTTPNTSG